MSSATATPAGSATPAASPGQAGADAASQSPTAPAPDGQPTISGIYRVDVMTGAIWAEVDKFDDEAKALAYAKRIVEVTRHEFSRAVLCGVKIGDVPAEDTVLELFEKPSPEELAAGKSNETPPETPKEKPNILKLLMYGVGLLLVLLVISTFGDKLKKIWNYLIGSWVSS